MLEQALNLWTKHHGPPSDQSRLTIQRLLAESTAFDLTRWGEVCQALARQGRRGRADLAALRYRAGASRQPRAGPVVDRAAYEALEAEARRAERERRASIDKLFNQRG